MAQIKPKGIAPELFTLAWRKRLTVAQALSGGRWMKGLRRILTTSQIDQFVHLYGLFCPPDIQWRFITCPPNQHIEFSSLGHTRTSTGESSGRLRRGGEQMQSYVWACRLLLQMRFASSAAPARSPPALHMIASVAGRRHPTTARPTQQTGAPERAQRVVYTAWNLWKERCRRKRFAVISTSGGWGMEPGVKSASVNGKCNDHQRVVPKI
jgi:hypothetical protein